MSTTKTIESDMRECLERLAAAIRNKDPATVLKQYAPDAVLYTLAPPLQAPPINAKDLNVWFATWQGPLGYEFHDMNIIVEGDLALCHGFVRLTGTKIAGEHEDLWFRTTLCIRNISGQCLIAHEHESVPFYMDGSFKAAINLTP